jgi:IS30 family transposase
MDQNPLLYVINAWQGRRVTIAQLARATERTESTVYRALTGRTDPPYSVALGYYEATREIEAATTTDGRESA